MTAEEWVVWLEGARKLRSRDAFEAWLNDPNLLPRRERFELWLRPKFAHGVLADGCHFGGIDAGRHVVSFAHIPSHRG